MKKVGRELEKCGKAYAGRGRKTIPQIVMEYGGVTLETLLAHREAWDRLDAAWMMDMAWRLFYGIETLEAYDIVHSDIKCDNVVVKDDKMAMIDFGTMAPATRYYESAATDDGKRWRLDDEIGLTPPESFVLDVMLASKNVKTGQKKCESTVVQEDLAMTRKEMKSPKLRTILQESHDRWTKRLAAYVAKLVSEKPKDALSFARSIDRYANKLDVYSLGIVLLRVLYAFADADNIGIGVLKKSLRLVENMIHPDPAKRFGPAEASQMHKRLGTSKNGTQRHH